MSYTYSPIIYDEEEIGKNIYEKGFVEEIRWAELVPLSKYMRRLFNCGDDKMKTLLNEFLSKTPYFVRVRMRGFVGKIVKKSKDDYIKTGSVTIRESEINKIREIKNFRSQKIALAILFISKREKNKGYVNLDDWKDVKVATSTSRITNFDIQNVLSYMYQNGFEINVNERYHQILFADNKSEAAIVVDSDRSARNLGNLYKEWCGGELGYCKTCSKEFVKNGKNHYYCEGCSKKRENERKRIHANKKRSSKFRVDVLGIL
jgi:hypothetical protein